MTLVTPTSITTVTGTVVRSPYVGPLAVVAIVIAAAAGVFIYGVIRKGL